MPGDAIPGFEVIDTRLGGWERVTAAYLVTGPAPVLVDPGSRSSLPVLLAALEARGVGADDLAAVVVTHVHLDHAGAVGDVARHFPRATVYVHERGAPHLADPSRLIASAGQAYGPLLDGLYGRLEPTPPERIQVLADGQAIAAGAGRELTAVHSPGHARHHLALLDSDTGTLLAGDAAGLLLPDMAVQWPATPPPEFDLAQALASLARFVDRRPTALALAHFGVVADPPGALATAAALLTAWAAVATAAWREGREVAGALHQAFDPVLAAAPGAGGPHRDALAALNGIDGNAAGLRRWLERTGGT